MSNPTEEGLLKKPERGNLFVGDNPSSGLSHTYHAALIFASTKRAA